MNKLSKSKESSKPAAQLEQEIIGDVKKAIAKKKPGAKPKAHTKLPTTNKPNRSRAEVAELKKEGKYGFKKGKSGNPDGRPTGSKNRFTIEKIKFLAATGQTPLEFLTAVYRDQLYEDYDVEIIDPKKGIARCTPRLDPITGELDTKKVEVKLEQRISAASQAAPFVHRKMPIGIDGGQGKPIAMVSAEALARLSEAELANMLNLMGKLGISGEFEGHEARIEPLEG